MASSSISLTHKETIWLIDHTSVFTPCLPDNAPNPEAMKDVRLKLLSVLLNFQEPDAGSELAIILEEPDLWILLETAKSSSQIGTEPVGMSLMIKTGKALLAVAADRESHAAVMQVGEGSEDEPSRHELSDRIREFEKKGGHDEN